MQGISTESELEHKQRKGSFSIPLLLVLGLLLSLCLFSSIRWDHNREILQVTEATERRLTAKHGVEAREAIERFEKNWGSMAMHENPGSIYEMLLTGPDLEYYQGHNGYGEDKIWLLTIYYNLQKVRLIEYSDQQMKVIGCYEEQFGEFDHNGNLLKESGIGSKRRYYVFMKDDGIWKLAGSIDLTYRHMSENEWYYLPQEFKDLYGDFYSILDKDCFGDD